MSGAEQLPEHVLAAIREAARRDVTKAPPLKPWQIDILRPLCAPKTGVARRRAA